MRFVFEANNPETHSLGRSTLNCRFDMHKSLQVFIFLSGILLLADGFLFVDRCLGAAQKPVRLLVPGTQIGKPATPLPPTKLRALKEAGVVVGNEGSSVENTPADAATPEEQIETQGWRESEKPSLTVGRLRFCPPGPLPPRSPRTKLRQGLSRRRLILRDRTSKIRHPNKSRSMS